jgi:hypothetical protein
VKVEKFEDVVRIHQTSSDEESDDGFYDKTDICLLRFNSHTRLFLLLEKYCGNPKCNCQAASLVFMEIDETGKAIVSPIQFPLYLDLRTWQEIQKPQRSNVVQELVDEFIGELNSELKIRLKNHYEETKEKVRSAIKFKMPITDLLGGKKVSFSEVFTQNGSGISGGTSIGFIFEFEGKMFWVEDFYCINPYCDCEEINLVFLESHEEKRLVSDLFTVSFSLRKGAKIDTHPRCTKGQAQKILGEWLKSEPDIFEQIKYRQKEMRQVGQRLVSKYNQLRLSPRSDQIGRKKKIGRNEPCPCGSGLKYKKCCRKTTRLPTVMK